MKAKQNIPDTIWVGMLNNIYISPDKILKIVLHHFSIKPEQILCKNRKLEIVKAKKIALYLMNFFLHNNKNITLIEMAIKLGYSSDNGHATVLHHLKTVENNIKLYNDWAELIYELKNKCNSYIDECSNIPIDKKTIKDAVENPLILEKY
jgi:chromosomal replication initiation ATPase DnaA